MPMVAWDGCTGTTSSTWPAPPCGCTGQPRHIGIGIGIGQTHSRNHVILLVQDLEVRVVNAITGELLRELTIDTNKDDQPREWQRPEPTSVGPGLADVLRHHIRSGGRI